MKIYDTFILLEDLNPVIRKRQEGTILEVYDNNMIEVEFVDDAGFNYEYNGQGTFTISCDKIKIK